MGQPTVNFTFGQGGSGRALQGFDQYSAMIAYQYGSSINTNYAAIGNKIYTSVLDAETDGVVNTCAEATAATSAQAVTAVGATGDTLTWTFTKWDGTVITLASYAQAAGDTTPTLLKTSIVAAINANTYLTGFSATSGSVGAWTLNAPKNFGTYPNTKSATLTIVGTVTATNAAFSGGTISPLAQYHYQISEFFRVQPLGNLYFSIKFDDSANAVGAYNTQVQSDGLSVLNAYEGQARQVLVYNPYRTFASSTLTALKALRTTLMAQYTPAVFGYVGGFTGALSAQENLRLLIADGVTAIIGQGISGKALELAKTQQQVICQGGTWLGTNAAASVSQSIGDAEAFPLSDGSECEVAGFFDGTLYKNISTSLGDQLHDYGYTFLRSFRNVSQTFWNAGNCAVSPSSDYAYMEDNRTLDKMVRGVYASIVLLLNRKNKVNANGTLAPASIAAYKEKADLPLAQMVREEDLSGFTVQVDETAVIATTGIVPISISAQQVVIGREIDITLGFVAKL